MLDRGGLGDESHERLVQVAVRRAQDKPRAALGVSMAQAPADRGGVLIQSTVPGLPADGVPPLLKQAVPLHEVVKVDVHVPGCPPKPNAILLALSELLEGRKPDLGSKLRFG